MFRIVQYFIQGKVLLSAYSVLWKQTNANIQNFSTFLRNTCLFFT